MRGHETGTDGRPMRPASAVRRTTALLAIAGILTLSGTVEAQDGERVPRIPAGVALVVAPVQSVTPTPAGEWPGGAPSRQDALAAVNSEVDFAISEEPLARRWTAPGEVVEQAGRNPMLGVDPEQLAYRGLVGEEDDPEHLYEPLHGQLRKLTALLDARLVVLPLRVWYARPDTEGDAERASTRAGGPRAADAAGRAVVRMAVVDTRSGRVLWKGVVGGDPAAVDSGAVLGTLASNLVRTLAPS